MATDTESETTDDLSEPLLPATLNGPIPQEEEVLCKNIPIALGFTVLAFASRSLWNQNVLAMFIYQITDHDTRRIGYLSSLMGLLQLISSFPGGYLADKYRRDTVLRCSAIIGTIAVALIVSAVTTKNFYFLLAAFSTVGIYWGLTTTSISALFADSLTDAQRAKYITRRYTAQKLGNLAAPIVAIGMFAITKNHWSVGDCGEIIYCSQAIGLVAIFTQFLMSDDYVLEQSEPLSVVTDEEVCLTEQDSSDDEVMKTKISNIEDLKEMSNVSSNETVYTTLPGTLGSIASNSTDANTQYDCIIPICICTADVVQGFANGMSVQFFPVFFVKELNLRPIFVQIVYILSQGGQAGGSLIGGKLGSYIGRCQAAVLLRLIGAIFLFLMVVSGREKFPVPISCTFYVLRMIFTNSTVPLTGSVLMDYVPKNHRGRWSSLDSIVKASWSGSAFMGGFLIHRFGIYSVFLVTLVAQIAATTPLWFLFKRVKD